MRNRYKLILCDIDGTLTDGSIHLSVNGESFKSFHVRDGLGVFLAKAKGVVFAIITGRESEITVTRARELGIEEVHQNISDKSKVVIELIEKYGATREQVAYIGDDVNDIVVKEYVGMFAVVGDAHPIAKLSADLILKTNGGKGALREFLDQYVL